MAHLLGAQSLHLEYPTKVIFESVTLGIDDGDRIGIVGRNGDGKSSLMRLLAKRIQPDSGQVTYRRDLTVGYLEQSDSLNENQTVAEAVVGETESHVWESNPKIRSVIAGLLGDLDWHAEIASLSGGQRRRVALAVLLTSEWDVLMLDEPTNHLDLEGVAWLAEHLKTRWAKNSGGLLVVTHDRWFLDEISNQTWEVHDGVIDSFEGGYAAYVLQRLERDRQAAAIEQKRQNLMRKELAWLRRGAPARTSKPKFRIDAANELIADVPPIRNPIELERMAMTRMGKDVVDLLDVGVSYGAVQVLHDVEWRIGPGERAGILGRNGAGKSTLLGLISGAVSPTEGRVKRGKTIKVAALTQQFHLLDDVWDERVSDVIARKKTSYDVGGKELTPGQLLERLGFTSAQLSTPVRDLSGGQKRRLQLLLILLDEPNVLILDEPTNDMDTDMLTAIEDLLDSWPGTLIVVSHDRYLLERVTDHQYAVMNGTLRHLPGGVDEYVRLSSVSAHVNAATASSGDSKSETASPASLAANKSTISGAERRNLEKENVSLERKIEKNQDALNVVHQEMVTVDQSDFAVLTELNSKAQKLAEHIAELEAEWLANLELLESS